MEHLLHAWSYVLCFPGFLSLAPSFLKILTTSLVAQLVKNLHAVQETQVQSLSQEDPLE